MREYFPDRWVLCHITSEHDSHYRFLAGWYGGYTSGDSWKLSSGILEDKVTMKMDDTFISPQSSGSTYIVRLDGYGLSNYMDSIASSFAEDAEHSDGKMGFKVLSEEEAILFLKKCVG